MLISCCPRTSKARRTTRTARPGTAESRHRYRPIGVNRTGHMVAIQVRPYVPAANRTVMWVSFGSGPFTAAAPFYANVNDTPAYLRDTTPEVSTGNLYWTNRLIAVVADAHWYETNRFIEGYAEGVRAFGHPAHRAYG